MRCIQLHWYGLSADRSNRVTIVASVFLIPVLCSVLGAWDHRWVLVRLVFSGLVAVGVVATATVLGLLLDRGDS